MKKYTAEETRLRNIERAKTYNKTKYGRANILIQNYKAEDIKYNRGECDLTKEWIVENIFTKPCAHCGKEGWKVIGCNRLDNSKPHTMDNVEPCCYECNCKLAGKKSAKLTDQIDKTTGEVIKTWLNTYDCANYGFNPSHIRDCCRGERKTHRGYVWRYQKKEEDI